MKRIVLAPNEWIAAVVPENAAGPGWANHPTWIYIASPAQTIRCECIQPTERSPELHTLFAAGQAMCAALADAVPTTRKN